MIAHSFSPAYLGLDSLCNALAEKLPSERTGCAATKKCRCCHWPQSPLPDAITAVLGGGAGRALGRGTLPPQLLHRSLFKGCCGASLLQLLHSLLHLLNRPELFCLLSTAADDTVGCCRHQALHSRLHLPNRQKLFWLLSTLPTSSSLSTRCSSAASSPPSKNA